MMEQNSILSLKVCCIESIFIRLIKCDKNMVGTNPNHIRPTDRYGALLPFLQGRYMQHIICCIHVGMVSSQ